MAGKRHHIIPRFLQKGFASRIEGDVVWTWSYTKGADAPREISTRDSIVSRNFYGKGDTSADDSITTVEVEKLAPTVEALRSGRSVSTEAIADLIAHVSIRTKFIRKGFEDMAHQFMSGMESIMTDSDFMRNAFQQMPDKFLKDEFNSLLDHPDIQYEMGMLMGLFESKGLSREEVTDLVVDIARTDMNQPQSVEMINDFFGQIFSGVMDVAKTKIRDGHNEGLRNDPIPQVRVEKFETFEWHVHATDFPLILGDSGTIYRSRTTGQYLANCDFDDISEVFLPISTRQVLVGAVKGEPIVEESINEAIASCSYEQFISAVDSEENRGRVSNIGTNAYIASETAVEEELDDIRQNLSTFMLPDSDN